MKHFLNHSVVAVLAIFVLFVSFGYAQKEVEQEQNQTIVHGNKFVDENGDGYNDNAPDHDGDGIPNGQDPDYQPANPEKSKRYGFFDEDGDGINDRMQDADGDGIPNCQDPDYVRPQDGTGNKFGQKNGGENGKGQKGKGFRGVGSGDGTGPKGLRNQGKKE